MTDVKDQAERGTCVAFSATSAVEALIKRDKKIDVNLSEQCLYYHCKKRDGIPSDGSYPVHALNVLQKHGVCTSDHLPYEPHLNKLNIEGNLSRDCNPYPCNNGNTSYFIKEYFRLTDEIEIKQALSDEYPVICVIPVFKSWFQSAWTEEYGIISRPLPVESVRKIKEYHAVCLTGYDDEYFYFKNSWGTDWARNCHLGAGYGLVPIDYVEDYHFGSFFLKI